MNRKVTRSRQNQQRQPLDGFPLPLFASFGEREEKKAGQKQLV
jgi:hypothetical protein